MLFRSTKKVADRLAAIFKENRKDYEEKWDDLKIFINYGMLPHSKSGWREIFWQVEVWKTQEYFVYFKFFIPMD